MFEQGACWQVTDKDLEVDSGALSLLAGEEDPSVAIGVASPGALPASGLGMNGTRARNASCVRSMGSVVLSRTRAGYDRAINAPGERNPWVA